MFQAIGKSVFKCFHLESCRSHVKFVKGLFDHMEFKGFSQEEVNCCCKSLNTHSPVDKCVWIFLPNLVCTYVCSGYLVWHGMTDGYSKLWTFSNEYFPSFNRGEIRSGKSNMFNSLGHSLHKLSPPKNSLPIIEFSSLGPAAHKIEPNWSILCRTQNYWASSTFP